MYEDDMMCGDEGCCGCCGEGRGGGGGLHNPPYGMRGVIIFGVVVNWW